MEGAFWRENPTTSSISLADLSTLLGGHIALCSSPELSQADEKTGKKTNFMKIIEQLPGHMKKEGQHRVTSVVDFAGSTSGRVCSNKIYGVNELGEAMTHAKDFDRDLSATKEYTEYQDLHKEDFEAKAKATGKTVKELATNGFAIKNSQWNSYWRGKVAGGLCMALTMAAGKSVSDSDLRELHIGKLQKNLSDLRAVIAVMIDGGPVTQEEQREMPQICDDVVFDLRRQGYDWASNAHVLLVRFPDVQTMLRSLDGEKNLCRSERFKMQQKDHFHMLGQHNLCWEFTESTVFSSNAGASLFAKEWEEALKYDEHISGMNLYQAAASGDAEGVKRVLQSKVRLTDVAEKGETALHALAGVGDSKSMRLLLGDLGELKDEERKAYPKQFKDDDERQEYVNKADFDGKAALHRSSFNGNGEVTKLLLGARASVDVSDSRGQTALHLSISNRQDEVTKLLLGARASVDVSDKGGQTALHLSSYGGNEEVTKLLLGARASVDVSDIVGKTALHHSSSKGNEEVTKLLLGARASVDVSESHGDTALHGASLSGFEEVTKLLLGAKASVMSKNKQGQTPLHMASTWGHDKVANLLLGAKASVNTLDDAGQTPLHVASYFGRDEVANLLLGAKASVNTLDDAGKTPLDIAREENCDSIVKLLTERQ